MQRIPAFEIREDVTEGCLRLSLIGELDRSSALTLDDRLTRLRVTRSPVRLDLSELQFIDTSGLQLLIRTLGDARIAKWQLQIEPDATPQVTSVLKLAHLDTYLLGFQGAPDLR